MPINTKLFDEWICVREELSAHALDWYIAECNLCDSYMTGSEQSVEDWGYEHIDEHVDDMLESGFPG